MPTPRRHSVNNMTTYRRDLSVPPDDIYDVHKFLEDIWNENSQLRELERYSVETAIIELTTNIILYSDVTGGVTCDIVVEIDGGNILAKISDNGDLAGLQIDEHIMPDEFSESGRGIPLIKALVDEFRYENIDNRNIWTISKKLHNA